MKESLNASASRILREYCQLFLDVNIVNCLSLHEYRF